MKEAPARRARPRAGDGEEPIRFGALTGMLGYQIRQAQAAVFRDLEDSLASLSVSPGEFGLLTLIGANPGANQTRIAAIYRVDKSTLSLRVSGLVRRGLVERSRSQVDQRQQGLGLTEEGRDLLRRIRRQVDRQERLMDSVLDPGDRERLLAMLSRIARAFEAVDPPPRGGRVTRAPAGTAPQASATKAAGRKA